jgi:hypothetical protein
MKGRMIIVAIAATLALAGSSIALGANSHQRRALPQPVDRVHPMPASLAKAEQAVGELAASRVRCRTLRCINSALTEVATAFQLMDQCMGYINIARYRGYLYSEDNGATGYVTTTGLDEVTDGSPATRVVTLTC